jgi:hypothetical protein
LAEQDGGLVVKLGKSCGHPSKRLAELQVGNPRKLLLIGYTFHLSERDLHLRFRHLRRAGEWFAVTAALLSEVRTWDWVDVELLARLTERLRQGVNREGAIP